MRGQEHVVYTIRLKAEVTFETSLIKPPRTRPMDEDMVERALAQAKKAKLEDLDIDDDDMEIIETRVWEEIDDDEVVSG